MKAACEIEYQKGGWNQPPFFSPVGVFGEIIYIIPSFVSPPKSPEGGLLKNIYIHMFPPSGDASKYPKG